MSVVALTVPLELSDAGAVIPIPAGGGAGNGVIFTVDTAGFNSISVQLNGVWEANVHFEISNDAVNWVSVQGFASNSNLVAIDTTTVSDVYLIPVIGRYFQLRVSGYKSGPIGVTAYLRFQSLAGIGEAALTQAMDSSIGTPIQTTFAGIQGPGQQPAKNSMPVALANEQVLDKFIVGRALSGTIPVNTILTNDTSSDQQGWIDCGQYRSIALYVNQSAAVTAGTISFEFSNDGVNLLNPAVGLFDTQGVDGLAYNSTAASTLSTTSSKTIGRFGNIVWKYFRIRVTTAITSTAAVIQAYVILRMTTSPVVIVSQANIQGLNAGNFPTQTVAAPNTAVSTTNTTTAFIPFGGDDKSVVNPQIQGAGFPIASTNAAYVAGPFYRRNYVDFTGGMGVSGPDPRFLEDKTYPVNVRLERTTKGQDSVQDLLQQILNELKAQTYYLREMPISIAIQNQYGNPLSAGIRTPMADDPENFYDDVTLTLYRKGS